MKTITKEQFVALLTDTGVTDAQKKKLHALFEQRHPDAHQSFLKYLGFSAAEVREIRERSRQG